MFSGNPLNSVLPYPEEDDELPSLLTLPISVEPTTEMHTRTLEKCFGSYSACDGSVTFPDFIFAGDSPYIFTALLRTDSSFRWQD